MTGIVVATTGGADAPHFKYRIGAYCRVQPDPVPVLRMGTFPDGDELERLRGAGDGQVLVLQRVLVPPDELRRLREVYAAVAFDFDDAIYASPPDVAGSAVLGAGRAAARLALRGSPRASSRRRPLRRLLPEVDLCVAGNSLLAGFARGLAPRVEVIPTTFEPLPEAPEKPLRPRVTWIGVPANLQYLDLIAEPLRRARDEIGFDMTIVSRRGWASAPFETELVEWSPEAQRAVLSSSTVGVSPLTDDAWTQGKCAHRAIVFAAHGVPAIASPVGITGEVVLHGETGFLARDAGEWLQALRACLTDRERAAGMGRRALEHVRANYADEIGIRRWGEVLASLARAPAGAAR